MTYQQMPEYMAVPLFQMPQTAQTWYLYAAIVLSGLTFAWAIFRSIAQKTLTPFAPIGSAAGACWPTWVALNSNASYEIKVFAATLTIVFSLLIAWLAIQLVAAKKPSEQRNFGASAAATS